MRNKKGDYKYGIILSLILGLMILSLSLYFIFNEYFTDEDIDWEICRQSIQLRSLLPEAKYASINWKSFKDDYPLKCKTMVKTIDENDVKKDKAEKIITESMAECWALYDNGDESAFPSDAYGAKSTCVPCARIHLTEEAKEYMRNNNIRIDIRNALDGRMDKDYSYYTYLKDSGKLYSAFNPSGVQEFEFDKDVVFNVDPNSTVEFTWSLIVGVEISKVNLPRYFYPDRGDLLINYGIITSSAYEIYNPYLFYFQSGQKPNPFDVVDEQFYSWEFVKILETNDVNFCESWEGIPA